MTHSAPSICYLASRYRSLARAARDNYKALSNFHVAERSKDADIVIFHFEPYDYTSLYRDYPFLNSKHVISYCVWEADKLPQRYIDSLAMVQEVWTASSYCLNVLRSYHPNVHLIPHIVKRDLSAGDHIIARMKRDIMYDPDAFHFLHIAASPDRRKNTNALVEVFRAMQPQMPNAVLIVKDNPWPSESVFRDASIVYLRRNLSSEEVNALYSLASAYVSPHHSEGWGYTMSDAMLHSCPCIATGYSGNLDYMEASNALLLSCDITHIRNEDCFYLFDQSMQWAYPKLDDIARHMLWIYTHRDDACVADMVRRGQDFLARFSEAKIAELMNDRIRNIALLH